MPAKDELSRTIRIDMIRDLSDVPAGEKKTPAHAKAVVPRQQHGATPGGPLSREERLDGITPRVRPDTPGPATDARYQELLQSIYDAALVCDLAGRVVDVNVRAIEFLLYEREELYGLTVFDIISGSDESLIQTLLQNLKNQRFALIQAYCIRKDGSFFPSEISVNQLKLGDMHLCFFLRDITLRREAERMLRTEHNAIQNSGNGIAITDVQARLDYVNPSVLQMWGYGDADKLLGQDVRVLLSDMSAADEMIKVVMEDQQTWMREMMAKRRDGSKFDVQVSAACNRNPDGEIVGIVFSFTDITDRKRAEEAMKESERHRAMLASLGAACHHLAQPATVLLTNLGIMQKKKTLSDNTIKQLVESSVGAAETLRDILHTLNAVNEYKTRQYLDSTEDSDANVILDISRREDAKPGNGD